MDKEAMPDSKETLEAKEVLNMAPVLEQGGKISYRKLAENLARLSGDMSEESVQRHLDIIGCNDEERKAKSDGRPYITVVICLLVLLVGILIWKLLA